MKTLPKKMIAMAVAAVLTLGVAVGAVVGGVTASNAARMSGNNSDYNNYIIKKVGWNDATSTASSLINFDGTINYAVASELMTILGKAGEGQTSRTKMGSLGYREWHAGNFSAVVSDPSDVVKSGGIFIKLFPTITQTDNAANGYLQSLTSEWYQVVYRSQGNGKDILTLYAANGYRASYFNQNDTDTIVDDSGAKVSSIHGKTYTYEGNYSTSIARHNLLSDWTKLVSHSNFSNSDIAVYFLNPSNLPGGWQSSNFQTGTNSNGYYYQPGTTNNSTNTVQSVGIGASGHGFNIPNATIFSLNNGMDGLSVGGANANGWGNSSIQSCYSDKIFTPSSFEIIQMGANKEQYSVYETYAQTEATATSMLRTADDSSTQSATLRHGLWQLNGYDRSSKASSWMRSGYSSDSTMARSLVSSGSGGNIKVTNTRNLRPALHLDLSVLAEPDPYEPVDVTDKEDLLYYKQTLERVLDGRNTDYTVSDETAAQALVTEMQMCFDTIYESTDDQETVDELVARAKQILQINDTKFKEMWGIIKQNVDGQDVEFTTESWAKYSAALLEMERLLGEIDDLNEQVATIAGLNTQIETLQGLLQTAETARDDYKLDYEGAVTEIEELEGRISDLEDQIQTLQENEQENAAEIGNLQEELSDLQDDLVQTGIQRDTYYSSWQTVLEQVDEYTENIASLNVQVTGLTEQLSDANAEVVRLNAAIKVLMDAQEGLTPDESNKGLDPMYIGILGGAGALFVGGLVLFAISPIRPKRGRKITKSDATE